MVLTLWKRWLDRGRELACRPLPWWGALLVLVGFVSLFVLAAPWSTALCTLYVVISGLRGLGKKGTTLS
jgi:hypothetical protein